VLSQTRGKGKYSFTYSSYAMGGEKVERGNFIPRRKRFCPTTRRHERIGLQGREKGGGEGREAAFASLKEKCLVTLFWQKGKGEKEERGAKTFGLGG